MSGELTHTVKLDYTIERLIEIWRAVASGEGRHGGFLGAFGEAFCHADRLNQGILKDAAVRLVEKYKLQEYGRSEVHQA